jgi:hypothetical protein
VDNGTGEKIICLTLSIGCLVVHVFGGPSAGTHGLQTSSIPRTDRIRIFPPATNTVQWPPPVALNDQNLPAFENPLGPLAATRVGVLLVPELAGSSPVRYELRDPGTRQVTRSFVNLIAASPAEIAWMPGCTASCRVHVLDLPGGHVEEISLPGRSTAYDGVFSPDGRLLALQVTARVTAAGRASAIRLLVAVVASGRLTAVPGTTIGSYNKVDFGWQAGSHRLIADVAIGTLEQPEWQIAVWRPGDAQLYTALARAPYESWPVIDQGPY